MRNLAKFWGCVAVGAIASLGASSAQPTRECPSGYYWSALEGKCMKSALDSANGMGQPTRECASGYAYSQSEGRCVSKYRNLPENEYRTAPSDTVRSR